MAFVLSKFTSSITSFNMHAKTNVYVISYFPLVAPLPEFEPVGCYKDNLSDRALPDHYANFRPFIDWDNMDATIRQCALVARDIGYEYFAVQFYGECWSSFDAANNYDRHGVQTNPDKCWANVGAQSTNFVYRFSQVSLVTVQSYKILKKLLCYVGRHVKHLVSP